MKFTALINAIAACMGADARVCSRYNGVNQYAKKVNDFETNARDSKLVVVDYKGADVAFNLRMVQLDAITVVLPPAVLLQDIAKEDETFKVFSEDGVTAKDAATQALAYSKLDAKYNPALGDLVDIFRPYLAKDHPAPLLIGASNKPHGQGVAFLAVLEGNISMVMQFIE